jgi:hypothetical protein
MIRQAITAAVLAAACTMTGAFAAEETGFSGLATFSEQIQEGKVDVGKLYSMDDKKGRFHLIHSEELDLNCESCHVAKQYAKDYLLVDRANAERNALGEGKTGKADVLDRSVCLGCHKTGGIATTWYQTADK